MKRRLRSAAAWLAGAVILTLALDGRAEHHLFRSFTGEDGLSQLSVRAMVQDSRGYVWLGTQAGLNRFDGRRFEVLGLADGLASAAIESLAVGPDGRLWVGSGKGIDVVEPSGAITPFGRQHGLVDRMIFRVAVGAEGEVWAASRDAVFVSRGGDFERVEALDDIGVGDMTVDQDGALWVGGRDGLWTRRRGRLEKVRGEDLSHVTGLGIGPAGRIFVGTAPGWIHVIEGGVWARRFQQPVQPSVIYSLHVASDGALWVGDGLGLVELRGDAARRMGAPERFHLTNVRAVLEDEAGVIWAGGFGGAQRRVGGAFAIFDEGDGLPSANTRHVVRTQAGELWVGTVKGPARLDGARFTGFGPEAGLEGHYVTCLVEDREGQLWAGTSHGLSVWRAPRWRPVAVHDQPSPISALAVDGAGALWVATPERGLFRRTSTGFAPVETPGNRLTEPRLLADSEGRVWVSGADGLSLIEGGVQTRRFGLEAGLVHPHPYYMVEAPDGALWFGYYQAEVGVSRFDGERVTDTYDTGDGLAHGAVYSLGFDAEGALWVGTARGVDRFEDGRFRSFGPPEGYPSTESNAGGFLLEPDGRIWFGTAEGLARYDPRLDTARRDALRFAIGRLEVGGVPVTADAARIPPGEAPLVASFELVSYAHPRQIELRARVSGLNEAWTELSEPEWSLPSLPAGDYALEVQARRRDEAWPPPARRAFTVLAPWWATPWAALAAALSMGALVLVGWRLRVRGYERQRARLTEMVEERTAGLAAKTAELERTQEELRQMNAELIEASRAKSQFVANVSHEIRTPMNGILGMTELALAEPVSPVVREYLETVQRSGGALLELINDILDLSRIESGRMSLEPAPLSLRDLLEGVRREHAVAAAKKGVALEVVVDPELPDRWLADPGRLRQVIVNLVGNALKFTSEGHVRIVVVFDEAPAILRFSVEDTGPGIPEDQHASIFEMFTQVDGSSTRKHGGTGLGLTICRQIVGLMGGEIGVSSAPGRGSTFTFTAQMEPAPGVHSDDLVTRPPEVQLDLPMADRGLRVLVAEDNRVNQLVVRRILERLGHSVQIVEDGQAAVAALFEEGRFDVVLMDVQMPNVDGIEATRRIRAREDSARRVPILALTAHAMTGDRERTLAAGMDGFLTKPISPDALRRALEALSS